MEVINWGHYRMFGIQSEHAALLLQGISEKSDAVFTTRGYGEGWVTALDPFTRNHPVRWRVAEPDIIDGLYANNPNDTFYSRLHA